MAMSESEGSIFKKFGSRAAKAFRQHATDEVEVKNFGRLPPGVTGVARLAEIKFDKVKPDPEKKDKQYVGEYYFYAAGVCLEPAVFTDEKGNKHKCFGLRTDVTEMICDTPEKTGKNARKTVEQHLEWVIHLCRLSLGAKFKSDSPAELEDWVAAINTAIKSKDDPLNIYFNFHTWAAPPATEGKNKGKIFINHFWDEQEVGYQPANVIKAGVKQAPVEPEPEEDEDDDDTEDQEEAEETPKPAPKTTSSGKGKKPPMKKKGPAKEPEPEPEDDEEGEGVDSDDEGFRDDDDLDSLAERADKQNDSTAKAKLTAFAKEAGIPKDVVKKADNWAEVVELMKSKKSDNEEEDEEPEEEEEEEAPESEEEEEQEEPEVDQTVGYKPLNKEGKEFKNPVACLIMKVNAKAKTVNLQNMESKKLYKDVPWGKLSTWE